MITYIPSKDRAAQLSILLNSIFENYSDIFGDIYIYYTHSNDEFKEGYIKVIEEFADRVIFVQSISFERDLNDVLKTDSIFLIVTDDSVVYRSIDFNAQDALELLADENILNISLRIGLNTTIIDYTNPHSATQEINVIKETDKFLIWDWVQTNNHLGHPFSCDGNIYRTRDILVTLRNRRDLRAMECNGRQLAYRRLMACQRQSSIVNSPNNQIIHSGTLNNGKIYGYTPKELNDMLLNGDLLSYEIPENIISVQQELNIKAKHNEI
jgi:hypothetical protein